MAQNSVTQGSIASGGKEDHGHGKGAALGPILCWAVVFADIGTSVYYVPGILYGTVGSLAGFFVFLTMTVFVLLTLKYAEVTHRFSQGGGVVTVAAQAMNHWVGAMGGMFILVDYFLTAAISCLSGIVYLSALFPALSPVYALWITVGVLALLGLLNWVGISESAKVSMVGALIAFLSDIAILVTVFSHISFGEFFHIFGQMFAGHVLGPKEVLIGFAGSFLAFSGLESISQLSPVMKTPRKRVAGIALLIVVLTIGLTSPLLTMLSTILLPGAANDPAQSSYLISLLAGHSGGVFLQTAVSISAGALLIFAGNTAIIGAYHVFMALSRMEFFPGIILKRNKLRGTPHYSIALATGVPILVLVAVSGRVDILGDMYAFGLLGAFSLTCLGLDIVRWREQRAARQLAKHLTAANGNVHLSAAQVMQEAREVSHERAPHPSDAGAQNSPAPGGLEPAAIAHLALPAHTLRQHLTHFWRAIDFWLGVLTTLLVALAWSTNLVAKPLATIFGGSVALVGMGVALVNYSLTRKQGRLPVVAATGVEGRIPGSVLAVLTSQNGRNEAIIRTAIDIADGKPVVFLYLGEPTPARPRRIFEVVDPYLDDPKAKEYFGKAENLARRAKISRRYVYRTRQPDVISRVWHVIRPRDIVISAERATDLDDVNPDRVRYEITPGGKVAHLLKAW
ncbi:MAG TPA: APC family permease [Ktedonobacteraceae bacterium]|jgi:amino acid transporter